MNPLTQTKTMELELTSGAKETVEVRLLTVRELYTMAQHLKVGAMPAVVALVCRRDVEWIDQLTPGSYAALSQEVLTANFPHLGQLLAGDPLMAASLRDVLTEINVAARQLQALTPVDGSSLPERSHESASSPDGPGTRPSTSPPPASSRSSRRPTDTKQSRA